MMANNPAKSSLYGLPRPKSTAKEISSSNSLAFTSHLSSLLSTERQSARTTSGRPRPSHAKSDIFATHNKNAKKRAARDLEDDEHGHHASRKQGLEGVDDAALHRSKRKMEEKARLYAAMKRGDYVPTGDGPGNMEEAGLVDFDRKWAENEERGQGNGFETSSDEDNAASDEDMVEYTDEFGRHRMGTKAEAAREERRKKGGAADEPDRFTARPAQPANLLYGDTVQTAAFNPDEPIAAKMEDLARKRDRSMTPPEEVHYDAKSEVRSKGVGFYAFAQDRETRTKAMQELERERLETEKNRRDIEERKEKRKAEIEDRRRKIRQKRGEKEAEQFLDSLAGDLE